MSNTSINQLFENQAKKTPQAIALYENSEEITYNELNRMSNKIAHYLYSRNIGKNDIVAIISRRTTLFVASVLGILKTGAAYLPIPANYPSERIDFILEDANPKACLLDLDPKCNYINNSGLIIKDILLDASLEDKDLNLTCDPNSCFYVIYTSGSTGTPKGAVVYQYAFLNLLHWYITDLKINDQDIVLLFTPIGFDLTQKNIFCTLIVGGKLCLYSSDKPNYYQLSNLIQDYSISLLNCTPSAFLPLIELNQKNNFKKLRSLRFTVLGGESIKITLLKKWIDSSECHSMIMNTYGPTECTDIATYYVLKKNDFDSIDQVPIGKAIPNVKLLVLNDQYEPDTTGELYIGGISIGGGYIGLPEMNQQSFVEISDSKFYKTGDHVCVSSDGNLLFLGRIDNMVKLHGNRIELEEIEYHITKYSSVKDVAVVIHTNYNLLTAYIVAFDSFNQDEIKSKLSEYLPNYMIPTQYIVLDELPLTTNGKIDRQALSNLTLYEKKLQTGSQSISKREEKLIGLLTKRNIIIDSDSSNRKMSDTKLDSLTFIGLIVDIENEFGIEIDDQVLIYDVFIELTFDELLNYIERKQSLAK